jgi:hypothetical protein
MTKKSYLPKKEKIDKLTKVYSEIKVLKPIKCDFFTKTAKLGLVILFMSSCSAQWHLDKAIKKDPSIIRERVVTIIDTLIVRDSIIQRDTFIMRKVDTAIIETEKFKTIVYRHHDTFRIETKIKGDTIRITKQITLPPTIQYKRQSIWPFIVAVVGLFLALWAMYNKGGK